MTVIPVIPIQIRRIINHFRERGAVVPERAIPESDIPHSGRWVFHRLVRHGVIRRSDQGYFLDQEQASAYRHSRRILILWLLLIMIIIIILGKMIL